MKLGASLDAQYLKMSRAFSDLEKKLVSYFFACAATVKPSAFFSDGSPDATDIVIKISELIPTHCSSVDHLDSMLANLLSVVVYYKKNKDFGIFSIIQGEQIGNKYCTVTLSPNALGVLKSFILANAA